MEKLKFGNMSDREIINLIYKMDFDSLINIYKAVTFDKEDKKFESKDNDELIQRIFGISREKDIPLVNYVAFYYEQQRKKMIEIKENEPLTQEEFDNIRKYVLDFQNLDFSKK